MTLIQTLIMICALIETYHLFYGDYIRKCTKEIETATKNMDKNNPYSVRQALNRIGTKKLRIFLFYTITELLYVIVIFSFIFTVTVWWTIPALIIVALSFVDNKLSKRVDTAWYKILYAGNCILCIVTYLGLFYYNLIR